MSQDTPKSDTATVFGFTFAASHTQTSWGDARRLSWPDIVEMLTSHVPGPKEGACITPATFTGSARKQDEAAQIDVAFLDSDSGASLDQIVSAIKARGWEAVVSSTHSHMSRRTEVSATAWDRYFAANPGSDPEDYLREKKGYLPEIARGATTAETVNGKVIVDHWPCPKFRIAIPLAKPWRAADYASQTEANAAWKSCIEALAAALGLDHDQACTDTSRLFYLPRKPPHGAVPETEIVSGTYCDIFALKPPQAPDLLNGHHINGHTLPTPSAARFEYTDPLTGEILDLTTWARHHGRTFLIAKAMSTRCPGKMTGLIVDNAKVHIDCPNGAEHTEQTRDNATFVTNGTGRDGFVIHCRHGHCTGKDRLFFVSRMLEERWLEIDDLTASAFQKITDGTPEPVDDPGYWQSIEIDAQHEVQAPEIPNGEPQKVFDPWNTLRPVRFPIEVLPEKLQSFVTNRGRIIGADPCAIAWACLSAASAAIDGQVRLQMKRHDKWSVPPALWVALIGAPSTKKTPVVDAAWEPLHRIQTRDLAAHQRAMAQWKSTPKAERATIPEPTPPRRLVSHDATMEKLQDILATQDRGIGVLRDELAGWIGSMEKYAPGKGGAADRAFALQSYNGGNHVVDRVMRGTLPINNLLTVMCGGIQPDRLRQFGDLTDDGLWQRFVPVIMAPAGMGADEHDRDADIYETIIHQLLSVHPGTRLHLEDSAHAIRQNVQERVYALEQSEVLGQRFVGFCGKLVGMWGRLTLVLHLIAEPGSQIIRYETADAARTLLFKSVLPNAARVYTAMGGAGADVEATQSIAGYILTKKLKRIVMSDLTSNVRVCRHRAADDVRKLLSPLEAGGWVRPEKEFAPTSWAVSDQVHVQFTAQAEKEAARRIAVRALITGDD